MIRFSDWLVHVAGSLRFTRQGDETVPFWCVGANGESSFVKVFVTHSLLFSIRSVSASSQSHLSTTAISLLNFPFFVVSKPQTRKMRSAKMWTVFMCLMLSFFARIESLSVTVNDVECVYEYVLYEGDTVSGNFVVVDHDIFWSSDHPGIDFTVSANP